MKSFWTAILVLVVLWICLSSVVGTVWLLSKVSFDWAQNIKQEWIELMKE